MVFLRLGGGRGRKRRKGCMLMLADGGRSDGQAKEDDDPNTRMVRRGLEWFGEALEKENNEREMG
ncbi:hypothetical protein ACLOJK_036056, partial [Asimina triloba]